MVKQINQIAAQAILCDFMSDGERKRQKLILEQSTAIQTEIESAQEKVSYVIAFDTLDISMCVCECVCMGLGILVVLYMRVGMCETQ